MATYKVIDKKGFKEAQIRAAFADAEGLRMFDIAVKEYAAGSPEKGVWATVQAGYDMVAAYYSTHDKAYPVGNIDTKAFAQRAEHLTGELE